MARGRGSGNPGRAIVKLKLKNMYSLLLFRRTPVADHRLREAKLCKTHLLTFNSDEASRDLFSAVSVSYFFNWFQDRTFFHIFLLLNAIVITFAVCLKTTIN